MPRETRELESPCDGLHMLCTGSGTIRRCGLGLGVGVALLEWAWPCWSGCVAVAVGLKTLTLAAWKPVFH